MVNKIDVGDVLRYLPASIRIDKADPKICVLSDTTLARFRQIDTQQALPKDFKSLDKEAVDLKKIVSEKKHAEKHKYISVIVAAIWVGIVASVTFLAIASAMSTGAAIIIPFVGLGLYFAGAGFHIFADHLNQYNSYEGRDKVLFLLSIISAGLSGVLHYAYTACKKTASLKKRISELSLEAAKFYETMQLYVNKNYAEFQEKLSGDLENQRQKLHDMHLLIETVKEEDEQFIKNQKEQFSKKIKEVAGRAEQFPLENMNNLIMDAHADFARQQESLYLSLEKCKELIKTNINELEKAKEELEALQKMYSQ